MHTLLFWSFSPLSLFDTVGSSIIVLGLFFDSLPVALLQLENFARSIAILPASVPFAACEIQMTS